MKKKMQDASKLFFVVYVKEYILQVDFNCNDSSSISTNFTEKAFHM